MDPSLLQFVGAKSVAYPDGFNIHERLRKFHVEGRLKAMRDGKGIDWATAEAMAIGTLLLQVTRQSSRGRLGRSSNAKTA